MFKFKKNNYKSARNSTRSWSRSARKPQKRSFSNRKK